MNIILLGPPGSGKGTQADFLKTQYGLMHLSTGERLRREIAEDTPLGRQAKEIIDSGQYVSDELIMKLVADTLELPEYRVGVIFDGYPRTVSQAAQLDKILQAKGRTLDHVIEMSVDEASLVKRISGRLHCLECGASYNEFYKPTQEPNVCDVCGGSSFGRRPDDAAETVKERLRVYREQTEPLRAYYASRGVVKTVSGMNDMPTVSEEIRNIIESE